MSRCRRLLIAVACCLAAATVTPPLTGAAATSAGPCTVTANLPSATGTTVTAGGVIQCFKPGKLRVGVAVHYLTRPMVIVVRRTAENAGTSASLSVSGTCPAPGYYVTVVIGWAWTGSAWQVAGSQKSAPTYLNC